MIVNVSIPCLMVVEFLLFTTLLLVTDLICWWVSLMGQITVDEG